MLWISQRLCRESPRLPMRFGQARYLPSWNAPIPFAGCSTMIAGPQLALETLAIARHREAEHEIDGSGGDKDFQVEALPCGFDHRGFRGGQKIENADNEHKAGILEEADEGIY